MRITSLTRYPVKSLGGESLEAVDVVLRGLAGDRSWYVRTEDGRIGSAKSSRRFGRVEGLLDLAATTGPAGPVVTFPDGAVHPVGTPDADAALAAHTGQPVRFAAESDVSTFDAGPVHLLTASALRRLADAVGEEVDGRRFRANVLLDDLLPGREDLAPEEAWRTVRLGPEVVLRVEGPMPRCVMVTMATRDLPADRRVLRGVHATSGGSLGVWATVVRPGRVAAGDEVRVET